MSKNSSPVQGPITLYAVKRPSTEHHKIELAKKSLDKAMEIMDNWPFDDIETGD